MVECARVLRILILLSVCWAPTHSSGQGKRPVTFDDLISPAIKHIGWQMDVSPSGKTIAYFIEEEDSLWLVGTDGGVPRPLGQGFMPRWSPDGRQLAFYSSRGGSLQLWLLNLESGTIKPLTSLEGGINPNPGTHFAGWIRDSLQYSWSPDGSKIAFASQVSLPAESQDQSFSRTRANGTIPPTDSSAMKNAPTILTTASPSTAALLGMFRTGATLGSHYVNGKMEPQEDADPNTTNQIFVVGTNTRTLVQLTKDAWGYFNPEWSPDGRSIVTGTAEGQSLLGYGPDSSDLCAFDLTTGARLMLTTGPGVKRLPQWSPNGKSIAYLGGSGFGLDSVFLVPASGGTPVNVAAHLDRDVQAFSWSADSQSFFISYRDSVSALIGRLSASTGDVERLTEPYAYCFPFVVSKTGVLVWVQNDSSTLSVIHVADPNGRKARIVLDANPQLKQLALGKQEVIEWRNSRGEEMQGILLKPLGYLEGKAYPLIVDPYPGPTDMLKFNPMLGNQAFASKGYAVFFPGERTAHTWPNPVKGELFNEATRGAKGVDIMMDDLITGIDALAKRGIVDPGRMCLYGFSNGGGATNLIVTRTARFRCAVSASGVLSDWSLAFFLSEDVTIPRLLAGETPWDDPATYLALSPIYHLRAVTTPMLLAVGENEGAILQLYTIELYKGLRYLDRDVTLLKYPEQGHGFEGAALRDYWQRVNEFLDSHLNAASASPH